MDSYATALSLLLAIVLLTTLQVKARDTKFFSKFNPQVDQPPSSEVSNYDGYHLNNRQSDIPTEEFIANINKGFTETNGFARDLDEHSYVTVPKDNMEKDSNDFYYPDKLKPTQGMHNMDASADSGGFELSASAEEDKLLNEKEAMNGYGTSYKKDHEKLHEAQGMSDTRTLEDGKYYYKPTRDNRGKGEYNEYFGHSEYKSKYDALKDLEYNHQNQVGFVP